MGVGPVESYPEDAVGRKTSGSFLYNATVTAFDRQGIIRLRRLGMQHRVVTKVVDPDV